MNAKHSVWNQFTIILYLTKDSLSANCYASEVDLLFSSVNLRSIVNSFYRITFQCLMCCCVCLFNYTMEGISRRLTNHNAEYFSNIWELRVALLITPPYQINRPYADESTIVVYQIPLFPPFFIARLY